MAFKMKGFSAFTKEKILPEEEAENIARKREEKEQANWPDWPKDGSGLTHEQMLKALQKDLTLAKANNEKVKIEKINKELELIKKNK